MGMLQRSVNRYNAYAVNLWPDSALFNMVVHVLLITLQIPVFFFEGSIHMDYNGTDYIFILQNTLSYCNLKLMLCLCECVPVHVCLFILEGRGNCTEQRLMWEI
jgi:hypothetical protein